MSKNVRILYVIGLTAILAAMSCSDRDAESDVGVDSSPDVGMDGSVDIQMDAAADTGEDAGQPDAADAAADAPDQGLDVTLAEPAPDLPPLADTGPVPDVPPLPLKKITFAHGSSSSMMNLSIVNSDGTGYGQLSGYGPMYFYSSYLYGRVSEYYPFSRDIPQRETHLPYYPIYLPRNLGYIRYFRDLTYSKVGVLLSRPDGTTEVLYSVPGTSTTSLYYYFAVSNDGDLVATHRPGVGMVLMRTNKTTFPGGKAYREFNPSPSPYYIYSTSVTLAGKRAYMVSRGTSSTSQHTLHAAAVDGKTGITPISMPAVGGVAPLFIDDEIAQSEDGKMIAVTAGASASSEDVIVIDDTGKATNISKSPSTYRERSTTWGYAGSGCQLDLSTKGTYVAYVKYSSSYKYDLHVAPTSGASAPVHVTNSSNVSSTYIRTYSLHWLDDENLIFTLYGSSSSYNDIYRYHAPTKTMTNLTKMNGTTKPFSLSGSTYFRTYGMWVSPNRQWLYFVAYHKPTTSTSYLRDIRAINLTNWKVKDITKGAEVYTSADSFMSCPGSSRMFFAAEPKAVSGTQLELFMFDQDTASQAVQLTSLSSSSSAAYNYIYDITPSKDCTHVAFRAGYSSTVDLHAGQVTSPVKIRNITNSSAGTGITYVYDYIGISDDNSLLVYFAGKSSSNYQMMAAPLKWSAPPRVVHKGGTGTYNYWNLMGIK